MAKKKYSRKELLKDTDEFVSLSSRALTFLTTHTRQLQTIGIAIGILIVLYMAVNTYFRYVNKKGHDAYNTAFLLAAKNLNPEAKPEDLKKVESLFTKVIDDHGLSKASRLALPQVAYTKFTEKQYDDAIAFYKKFLKKVSGDAAYESLANLALAACYEAKGDLKTAMTYLNPVVKAPEHPFKETAMLSLARLYRLDNNPEKAKEILEDFVENYTDSPFLSLAKAQL